MGNGFAPKCKKCGYEFHALYGVGMFFPYEYRKQMEAGRRGELGEKVQRFLKEHPDGVLDIERTAMQCTKCGEYASNMKLNMYLPVEGKIIEKNQSVRWSIAAPAEDVEYVDPDDLRRYYRLAGRYTHICEHCGGRMRYVSQKIQRKELTCPHCKAIMDTYNFLFWD